MQIPTNPTSYLYEDITQSFIRSLSVAVSLGIVWRRKAEFDIESVTEVLKSMFLKYLPFSVMSLCGTPKQQMMC